MIDLGKYGGIFADGVAYSTKTEARAREVSRRVLKLVSGYRGKKKRAKAFRRFMRFIRKG